MTRTPAASPAKSSHRLQTFKAAKRRTRLRHIHRMTHEQQIALVEEARAARQAEQARETASPPRPGASAAM